MGLKWDQAAFETPLQVTWGPLVVTGGPWWGTEGPWWGTEPPCEVTDNLYGVKGTP